MNDNDVIEYLLKYKQIKWKFLENNIKEYLLNRYDDNYSSCEKLILKESYYRILNNIEKCPICPICGNKCKFSYFNYLKTCGSPKCLAKECQKRREQTNFEKYGYYGNFGNKHTQDKAKQTIISKYDVDNVFKLKEIREKSEKTKLKKYGNKHYHNQEKIKQTCLERYNSTSPLGNREIWEQTRKHTIEKYGAAYNKEKLNETLLQKYGVKWFTQSQKLIDKAQSNEAKEKQYKTKKKNHTLNSSKIELESYDLLKQKYPDVIHHYKDNNHYPFSCDFYIPGLDLFIECNYHWTHGGHPYNENNKEDIETLNKWKEKDTKFYVNAITTWTIRDVNKRNIVKQNNLNYIEFWNIEELKNWIDNGK
jgi:hypothetical protein